MKKIFDLTNKFIVLATPLILFSLISNIFLAVSMNGKLINILINTVLFILMLSAFSSGWFFLAKRAIENPDMQDPNSLIKDFTFGVGEYFLSTIGLILNVIFLSILFLVGTYFVGVHFIGDLGISSDTWIKAFETTETLKNFLSSLNPEQIVKINQWNLLLLGEMMISYFIYMFYVPALFFKSKNPFKAFFISLKDLFNKRFIKNLGLYLLIFITNFIITLFSVVFGNNIIMHFVLTLANFYFITLITVGIFNYYYNKINRIRFCN